VADHCHRRKRCCPRAPTGCLSPKTSGSITPRRSRVSRRARAGHGRRDTTEAAGLELARASRPPPVRPRMQSHGLASKRQKPGSGSKIPSRRANGGSVTFSERISSCQFDLALRSCAECCQGPDVGNVLDPTHYFHNRSSSSHWPFHEVGAVQEFRRHFFI
jgi:hypothetical protein